MEAFVLLVPTLLGCMAWPQTLSACPTATGHFLGSGSHCFLCFLTPGGGGEGATNISTKLPALSFFELP